jgi:hypothetical protein
MMTEKELEGTIDYLKGVVHSLKDRDDHERFQENIDRLEAEIRGLEERKNAL